MGLWAALLCGHVLVLALPFPPDAARGCIAGAFAAGACSLAVAALAGRRLGAAGARSRRAEAALGWLALVFAGGALGAETDGAAWPLPVHPAAVPVEIRGVVEDASGAGAEAPSLCCVVRSVRAGGREVAAEGRLLLRWRDPEEAPRWAAPGLVLRARGRFRPPEDARNFGGFAAGRWLERAGIDGTLEVEAASVALEAGTAVPWSAVASGVREGIGRRADADLSAPVAALLRGMLLGDRAGIASPIEDAFRSGGTIHVLSISGLHVCILAGMVALGAAALRLAAPAAASLELAALWGYVLFVGAPVPAIRSALLWTLLRAGRLAGRPTRPINAWGSAGLLLHLVDPASVLDAGFQLSFAAVLGLLAAAGLSPGAAEAAPVGAAARARAALRSLAGLVASSAGAEAATLGLQARLFGAIPVAGIALNLVIVPLCGLFMAEAVLYIACALLAPPLAPGAAAATDAVGLAMIALTEWTARLWPAIPAHAIPSIPATAAGLAALLAAACAREGARTGRGSRGSLAWLAAGALAAAAALPLLWPERTPQPAGALRAVFLDVGQGDATLLFPPGGDALLVDAGPAIGRSDAGRRVVEPALRSEGVRGRLDCVLSHAHGDHSGGLPWLARRGWIGSLLENGSWRFAGERARLAAILGPDVLRSLARDTALAIPAGRALLLFAAPRDLGRAGTENTDENDRSLVTVAEAGGRVLLLAGDVEAGAERVLVTALPAADVLKVPHHGSRTSCDALFLAAIRPRLAVISCGEGNRFGHPDRATVGRLLLAGARVVRTDLEGAVRVTVTPGGAWISTQAHPAPESLGGPGP